MKGGVLSLEMADERGSEEERTDVPNSKKSVGRGVTTRSQHAEKVSTGQEVQVLPVSNKGYLDMTSLATQSSALKTTTATTTATTAATSSVAMESRDDGSVTSSEDARDSYEELMQDFDELLLGSGHKGNGNGKDNEKGLKSPSLSNTKEVDSPSRTKEVIIESFKTPSEKFSVERSRQLETATVTDNGLEAKMKGEVGWHHRGHRAALMVRVAVP